MTSAALREPLAFETVAEVHAAIRAAGCRLTTPRKLLIDALFRADGPVSAEYVSRGPGAGTPVAPGDLASTYRNLELFERLGVVRHLHAGHGPGLYVLAGRGEREYLVCERCGRVLTVEPEALSDVRERIRERFSFEARFSHFPLLGVCESCAQALRADDRELSDSPGRASEGGTMHDHEGTDHVGHTHEGAAEHEHDGAHAHEHSHGEEAHSHAHDSHDHDHTAHEHEHSHGDHVHSHPHVHQEGLEHDHAHEHHTGERGEA